MNSTKYFEADKSQILMTNVVSTISTLVNFSGFYVIINQKTRESRTFTYAQLFYQMLLYATQVYAGTILNIVFLFPVPGVYCIGWLRNLSGIPAAICFAIFDILFSVQGMMIAILMFLKTMAITRPKSPFKASPSNQKLFISSGIGLPIFFQMCIFTASYSSPSNIGQFLKASYPQMTFLTNYPFLWMLTSKRNLQGFFMTIVACIGIVFMIVIILFIILIVELDLQVNTISQASNKYHKRLLFEFMIHIMISLPFFILSPLLIFLKIFLNDNVDVSFLTSISFAVFTSAPIPSMLVFLLKNKKYRSFLIKLFHISQRTEPPAKSIISRQTVSRVRME